jgi:hypothetical protein
MRKTDGTTHGGSYKRAKGSASVGSKGAPKQVKKSKMRTNLAGWMDSRPENSDRNQSAR